MNYKRTVLPNGLRVITIPMEFFESVTVMVLVGSGSRYETKLNNGVSHFLEHMAFKGTKKRPNAMIISSLLDSIGGRSNAFTDKEITGYYIKSLKTHLETCLDVIADILQNSLFDPKEIDKERGVINGEIDMYEDTPTRKIGDIYQRLLYGDVPMGWDTAGEKKIINSLKREDFMEYLQNFYSSDNLTVVVAGNMDNDKTVGLVEKYFGKMKQFETKKYTPVVEHQTEPQVVVKKKKTEQVHIALGVRTVSTHHEDKYALEILAEILGGGMSSRLFHEVREKRGLGYYVKTHAEFYKDCGNLTTYTGVDPKKVEEAVMVIKDQYKLFYEGKANITPEELSKAKEATKGFVLEMEDSRAVAHYYAEQEILEEAIEEPTEVLQKIDAITIDDINRVAKKYLSTHLNLAVIGNFTDGQKFKKLIE